MDVTSYFFALLVTLIAFVTAFGLYKNFGVPEEAVRYGAVDGLRGYLALFVFIHHASIWYLFLNGGRWEKPSQNLFLHFGETSVVFFFMITGFLFFSKLLDGRDKGIDWLRYFVSRVLRLGPLYLFAMGVFLFIIAYLSRGSLNSPFAEVIGQVSHWLFFTIFDHPNINGIHETSRIVAGVTWSLRHEWFFYCLLPLLAFLIGNRVPSILLVFSLVVLGLLLILGAGSQPFPWFSFACGALAVIPARSRYLSNRLSHKSVSYIAFLFLFVLVFSLSSAYGLMPKILILLVFTIIASGNTLFGLLTHPASRTLGHISYSLYILHGIFLFTTFRMLPGIDTVTTTSLTDHWLTVLIITPLLISSCFFTFKYIEYPSMHQTNRLTSLLRSRFN